MAVVRKPVKTVAETSRPAAVPAPRPVAQAAPQIADDSIAATPAQVLEFASAQAGEFQEVTRDMALRSVESVRAAYDRTRIAAEEAAGSLEQSFAKSTDAVRKLHLKAIENMQAHTLALFDLSKILAGSANASDAIALVSEHCRKQVETATTQSREFAELAKSLTEEALSPLGASVTRAFGIQA